MFFMYVKNGSDLSPIQWILNNKKHVSNVDNETVLWLLTKLLVKTKSNRRQVQHGHE